MNLILIPKKEDKEKRSTNIDIDNNFYYWMSVYDKLFIWCYLLHISIIAIHLTHIFNIVTKIK